MKIQWHLMGFNDIKKAFNGIEKAFDSMQYENDKAFFGCFIRFGDSVCSF